MFGEYRPEDLKRVKEIELEILIEFIRICEKHDLKYFASVSYTHLKGRKPDISQNKDKRKAGKRK